jgi:NAD(P)-dependent dehydrogenase (short-subunit alcohol dehydrogenase family)
MTTASVLIFGATGGIGRAIARRLVERGQPVFLAARGEAALAALATELGGARFAVCDVGDPVAIAATVVEAAETGRLAGLTYCVGSIVLKPLKRATPEDFHTAFALNAVGAALAVQAAEPALRAAGGAVVLFSTVAAASGFPNHAVTAAAKGAVEALTRSLAADLAPDVRVNCIAPSLIDTPLAKPLTGNPAMAKAIAALHPLPRLGLPDDVAAAAVMLLGAEAGWITGQVLAVDGGRGTVRVKG